MDIKFRGHNGKKWLFWDVFGYQFDDNGPDGPSKITEHDEMKIDTSTIGQYSGIKDRNRVEIFDGDILQTWFLGVKSEIVLVVKREGAFYHKDPTREAYNLLHSSCKPFNIEPYNSDYYEIIGNIYDNPEILKQ